MSSVIANSLDVVLLKNMSPILDELGYPDSYQPSSLPRRISKLMLMLLSVPKKFYSTGYIHQGNNPFLCCYKESFWLCWTPNPATTPTLVIRQQLVSMASHGDWLKHGTMHSPTSHVEHKTTCLLLHQLWCETGFRVCVLSPLSWMNSLQRMRKLCLWLLHRYCMHAVHMLMMFDRLPQNYKLSYHPILRNHS